MTKPFFLAFLLGATILQATAQDSTLVRLIRQNQSAMTAANGQFAGPAWPRLEKAVQASQCVLVGEAHGVAQVPQFTAAVARIFKPAVFVAEIDQYQAADLSRLVAQPGPPTAYLQQYPMGLSFYSWVEEYELARALHAQGARLVGVDQVSLLYTGRFFELLAAQAKGKAAKAYLQGQARRCQAWDRAALQQDSLQHLAMYRLPQAALDSVVLLTSKEKPAVRAMVQNFVTTRQIYNSNGHQQRVNLMKKSWLGSLPAAGTPGPVPLLPKTLFKFGANHMARNLSVISGVFDLGSLVPNLADAQGQRTLHLLVVGKQGTQLGSFSPTNTAAHAAPYTAAELPYLKPFFDLTGPTDWNVVDLRPLRRAIIQDKLQVLNQEQESVILGYDFLVVIPETTNSRFY
ncbi:hypothetical protein [Hymenobacter saemangeumensis]|uniref:hypothetical protein n=1 Tax=Hymenobacter saemangeumensis TaxID=1084522 RepID=UPI0031E8DE85